MADYHYQEEESTDVHVEARERQKQRKLFLERKVEEAKLWIRRAMTDGEKWDLICRAEEKYGIGGALEAWVRVQWPDFQKPRLGLIAMLQERSPEFWGSGVKLSEEKSSEF